MQMVSTYICKYTHMVGRHLMQGKPELKCYLMSNKATNHHYMLTYTSHLFRPSIARHGTNKGALSAVTKPRTHAYNEDMAWLHDDESAENKYF